MDDISSQTPFTLYDVQRSPSWAGYDFVPTVKGGPSFKINQRGKYSGRIVEYSKTKEQQEWVKIVELWSLNADGITFPFFSGVRDPNFAHYKLPPMFHRADGHLGPFDCTEHPQEFCVDAPWLPFMEPYSRVVEWANVLPALDLKQDDACSVDEGLIEDLLRRNYCLDLQLWSIKEKLRRRGAPNTSIPDFPKPGVIRRLAGTASYQHVIQHIVTIQRGLRRKNACVKYYSTPSRSESVPLSEFFRNQPIPAANMGFIGLWGNSLNREQLAWYHNVGKVPVYFSHQLTTEEMADILESSTYEPAALNIVEQRFSPNSPYDEFAINKGCELILEGMPSGACQPENQNFDPHTPFSSSRSQSYTQMREPRSDSAVEQHLKRTHHGYHAYAWTRDMFPEWHADFGGHQTNTLDKYRVPAVVIPALTKTTTGSLVKFTAPGFILSQYHIETYGMPAPRWRLYSLTSDGYHILQFDSLYWMYRRIEDAHNEARNAPEPDVNLLRFTDNPLVHDETTYYVWSGGSVASERVDVAVGTVTPPVIEEITGPGPTAEPNIPMKRESPRPDNTTASRSATASDRGAQGDLSVQDGRDRSSPSVEDAPNNGSTPVDPGADTSTAGPGSVNQRAEIILRSVRQLQMIAARLQTIAAEESSAMEMEAKNSWTNNSNELVITRGKVADCIQGQRSNTHTDIRVNKNEKGRGKEANGCTLGRRSLSNQEDSKKRKNRGCSPSTLPSKVPPFKIGPPPPNVKPSHKRPKKDGGTSTKDKKTFIVLASVDRLNDMPKMGRITFLSSLTSSSQPAPCGFLHAILELYAGQAYQSTTN
ncbi:hypothetical protein EDD85DRAFT_786252 [Armillaria nabsnona]|nr:hypothetical protein EDD85DRAFT_786252 [Armillaria nabsnona]